MGFSIRRAVVLACVLSVPWPAHAQPAELSLAEVVKVAVRQSPELERARIDVDAARAALLHAKGIEDVHVRAIARADVAHASPPDNQTADQNGQAVDLSIGRALPTGGTVAITASGQRQHDK